MQFVSEYTIRAHEIAPDYTLKRHHVCSYFQDAAALFFAGLGIGTYDLQDRGYTWIVTRMFSKFHSPVPVWSQNVRLTVWPRRVTSVKLYLDFEAHAEEDADPFAYGTSSWAIISEGTRNPQRLDTVIDPPKSENRRAFADRKLGVLEFADRAVFTMEQPIRSYDLDFNLHLNSVRYIAGAIETVPYEFRTSHELASIDAAFVKETYLGDPVRSECARADDRFVHRFVNTKSGDELFQMVSEWTPCDS